MSRTPLFAAIASAVLFGIAFPPFAFVVPIFLCLAPLAAAVAGIADREGKAWDAARLGMLFSVVGYGINLYWIAVALSLYTKLSILGYLGSLVWLAPFVGLATTALYCIRRYWRWPLAIALPVVWVALEVVLNYLADLSFPWLPLGLGVSHIPVLAQFADVSGVRGVSFWIAMVNGCIADAWLLRHHRRAVMIRLAGAFAVLVLAEVYGMWRMTSVTLTPFGKVAVIQPNIPQPVKLSDQDPTVHVGTLTQLTRAELQKHDADLVVWPEAALDRFLWQYPRWRDSLRAAVADNPTPILTGMLDSNSPQDSVFKYYNAAMITESDGSMSLQPIYHKQFLVPIVERVPFLNPDWFRRLDYFGGYGRGTNEVPFKVSFGGAGTLICYESIYPQLSRSYAKQGAAVLVNITNDAWFQRSLAPYQHFSHMIMRSIETRLPSVRSANTGISGYIDPLGRVREKTPIFTQYTGTYTIESANVGTLYVRFGDWIGILCVVGTIALVMVGRLRREGQLVGLRPPAGTGEGTF